MRTFSILLLHQSTGHPWKKKRESRGIWQNCSLFTIDRVGYENTHLQQSMVFHLFKEIKYMRKLNHMSMGGTFH